MSSWSKLQFYLFLLSTNFVLLQAQQPDQVIEFFRHGARGPNTNYDPQWSRSELNQLTKVGMVQHYNLGKAFGTKYSHLVASGYDPDDVYVISSSSQRCIESSMVHVSSVYRGLTSTLTSSSPAGLQDKLIAEYESLLPSSESSRGDYVPVNVYVPTTGTDNLIFKGNGPSACPSLQTYIDQNIASPEVSQGWTKFQTLVQEVNAYLSGSQVITDFQVLVNAYDAFIADEYDGKTLPGGITDTHLVESLGYGSDFYLYSTLAKQEVQRGLFSFNTLQGIMDQLYNFRQGSNAKKLVFMGGHDSNMYAMLSSFGVITADCLMANYADHESGQDLTYPNCQFPKFAANIIFEFYNDTTSPYVKVFYNDVILPLCDGQETCSYDDFMRFMRTASGSASFEAWNITCGNVEAPHFNPVSSSSSSSLSTGAKIGIIIGSAVGATILLGIGFKMWSYSTKKVKSAEKANFQQQADNNSVDAAAEAP